MQDKIWKPSTPLEKGKLEKLSKSLGVPPLYALLLHRAGVRTKEEMQVFLQPDTSPIHDPFLMRDMHRAVERISQARETGQKIRIYGDYDVDGTTSVAVVYQFLKDHFEYIDYYIPDREKEGYGISARSIEDAIEKQIDLVIALDCGIRSVDLIAAAKAEGVDFIVCDHHTPGDQIPDAVAVLNPKRSDCEYPFKELSGCGIGWKLICALVQSWDLDPELPNKYLDMLAVSICSDLVSMTGENRVLTAMGLRKLSDAPSPGLQMVIDKFIRGDNPDLYMDVTKVVFMIGPRINAAGRLKDAEVAVRLLLAESEREAEELALELNELNKTRQGLDREMTEEALSKLESDPTFPESFSTVVYDPSWHKGVVGIVASRLLENYYKPTIVLTGSGDQIVGSARSIEGFDIHEALTECSEHLEQFGGHKYAAGMRMRPDQLNPFRNAFEAAARKRLNKDELVPKIYYDAEIPLQWVNRKLYENLQKFSPFGPDNLQPIFLSHKVIDTGESRTMGKGHEHLRMNLITPGSKNVVGAVAFGFGHIFEQVQKGTPMSIVYHIDENHFNGRGSLQLMVLDIKIAIG